MPKGAGPDKASNLSRARAKILEASQAGAKIVVPPECFNSPYGTQYFPQYAETLLPTPPSEEQSPSYHALSSIAKEAQVYLVGGSIPEYVPESKRYYNTSLTFNPSGKLLGTYRKLHLSDLVLQDTHTVRESDVLTGGDTMTVIDLEDYGKIAIAICFDVRFPELSMIAARQGVFALISPSSFNLVTGKTHWELQARARAVDNQIYVAFCSPARDMNATHPAWGHSILVDPMAEVLCEAYEGEEIVYGEMTNEAIVKTRKEIPLYQSRRFDIYPDLASCKVFGEEAELK